MSEQVGERQSGEKDQHEHLFVWVGGRYACACGAWCYDLPAPTLPPTTPAAGDPR